MPKEQNKKVKKGKELLPSQQWIEMEDLHAPQNKNMSKKLAQLQGNHYIPPSVRPEELTYPEVQQSFASQTPQVSGSLHQAQQQSRQSPSTIKVQIEQKREERPRKKHQPSLPMMQVQCGYCTVSQKVPGNTQVYCCGSCENMNECYPLYGIVICGCCQAQLGFGFGMSEYVKCPKCYSVNKVPTEPKKQYQSISVLGGDNLTFQGASRHQERQRQRERQPLRQVEEEDYQYIMDDKK